MRFFGSAVVVGVVTVLAGGCSSKSDLSFLPERPSTTTETPVAVAPTTTECGPGCGEAPVPTVPETTPAVLPYCGEYAYNDFLPLRYCQEGRGIRYAQEILVGLGYDIEADSYLGKASVAAIRDFQSVNGLAITGMIDRQTWRALDPTQSRFPGTDLNGDGLVTPDEFGD
ncbi:MAG: putative peptidoglycan binding domain [Actinomycetota bacterium]